MDPCDGHTANCLAAVERDIAREQLEDRRVEEEYAQALEDYFQDVGEYHHRIVEFLVAWLEYAHRIHDAGDDTSEPVFPQPPIHPDNMPSETADPNAEIPY